jgi:hypothetical protein
MLPMWTAEDACDTERHRLRLFSTVALTQGRLSRPQSSADLKPWTYLVMVSSGAWS